jgi:dTDP-4-dehydrorhamnose reductase
VHISTDAVFGADHGPSDTSSIPSPINHYGRSKLAGERQVMGAMPAALVVRTNIVGWSPTGGRSLLEFFWSKLDQGESVPGFDDVAFRPFSASDMWSLVSAWLAEGATGLRHATGAELISKHEFGVRVARCFDLDQRLVLRSSVTEANLGAERAPSLDVLPSALPEAVEPDLIELDAALARLRDAKANGYRDILAGLLKTEKDT